jgi:hypothetical protein
MEAQSAAALPSCAGILWGTGGPANKRYAWPTLDACDGEHKMTLLLIQTLRQQSRWGSTAAALPSSPNHAAHPRPASVGIENGNEAANFTCASRSWCGWGEMPVPTDKL